MLARPDPSRDHTLEKALPSNIDAERMILGAILLDNDTINQAVERLKTDDFLLASHRRIYDKMIKLYEQGRGIDPITLQEELRRAGDLDFVGGPAQITSLFDGVPRFSNIENYTKIVKDMSMLRRMINASHQIEAMCYDNEEDAGEILDRSEAIILSIAEDRIKQGFVHIGEVAGKQLDHIEEVAGREQVITGIATGFRDIDYMTSGFQRGDLIIIAARPSMGKTALAIGIAQHAALHPQYHGEKAVVGIFSLEMSKEQLVQRMLCSQARVDAHRLRTGMLNKDDWRRLAVATGELSEAQIFLDDTPGISVLEMRAKARRLKNEHKALDLIIVDYLQLMSGHRRSESRQQEVSQISRDLKILAKELNVPLIALSQLSRAPETRNGNHKPQLSDLRESGCLAGDTMVTIDTGEYVRIDSLMSRQNYRVLALNLETWKLEPRAVTNAFHSGLKPIFELRTRLGKSIRATGNHKFLTIDGWKRLDELRRGERIAIPRQIIIESSTNMLPPETLTLLGHLISMPHRELATPLSMSYCASTENISRERLAQFAASVKSMEIQALVTSDIYWDEIARIAPDAEEEVYDITVVGLQNFIANDIIVHNSLEQDSDVVMFIYRDEVYNPETEKQNIAEIIIGKQRNGPTGTAELVFLKQLTSFEDRYREDWTP